jgi:hypothetical protein
VITTSPLVLKIPEVTDYLVHPTTPGTDDTIAWLNFNFSALSKSVINTISISNGNGITGGGDLSASRTLALTTLTSDWDIGDGRSIRTPKIIARSNLGLSLFEYGGAGIFIKHGGNVGIGVDPLYKLDINGGTASQLHLSIDGSDNGAYFLTSGSSAWQSAGCSNDGVNWVAKATTASIVGGYSGQFDFYTNTGLTVGNTFTPSLRMRINSSGYVGIGATTPVAPLNVVAPSNADQAIVQQWAFTSAANKDSSGGYNLKLKQTVISGVVKWTFDQYNNSTYYSDIMTLDRGNVGIGTVAPSAKLVVAGNTHIGANTDPTGTANSCWIDGDLKVGTNVGFYGTTPVTRRTKATHNNWASLGDVVNALVELGLFDAA